uniref:Holin n=1 Tax=uncultured marine virus TaxID=186617 RepID=A0A0F7L8T7_9VIRU|nr:hypothetical protein [uncultured marine virus]
MKNIINKLKEIGGSVRFWQVFAVAVLQSLVALNFIETTVGEQIADILSTLLGVSVTIRTVDSFAKNVSSK